MMNNLKDVGVMVNNPFESFECPYRSPERSVSFVRVLHASPNAPAVDIYVDRNLIVRGLRYQRFTRYLPVSPGKHNIRVFPTGKRTDPVINTEVTVPVNTIYTAAVIGTLPNISLFPVNDPIELLPRDKVFIRFVHLSPNAPKVDITLPNGTKVFEDVEYKEITDYQLLNPGTYTFDIRIAGTDKIALRVPHIILKPNRFYSLYAVGLAGGKPPLQVLIPLDGNSYIKFKR